MSESPASSSSPPVVPPEGPVTHVDIFSPEFAANPREAYARILADGPVVRHAVLPLGILISGYEEVVYAMRHPEIFASRDAVSIGNQRPMIPLQIDPPDHVQYRKLLDPLFSNKKMLELEPSIRKLAGELIDGFASSGECDFNKDFAVLLPSIAFLRLLGLPVEDLDKFLAIKDGIIRPDVSDPAEAEKVKEHWSNELYDYFGSALDAREKEPMDDLLSWMVSAEVDGKKLTREQILDICYLMLLAGLDTVTATLDCMIHYLATHPEQRQLLLDEPELLDNAIEEMLRTETPVTMIPRLLVQDTTLAGIELKAGEKAMLMIGAANVDAGEFDSPDEVDFRRERVRHQAFGGGNHRCLGSHLARMELRVALQEFHARIPHYRIKEGADVAFTPGIRQADTFPLVFESTG